jgi:2-haloacid dehalogenase
MAVKALTFDIIGTVFDWRGTFASRVTELNVRYGRNLDPVAFAEGAHRGYASGVQAVRAGKVWKPPDEIHRESILGLLGAERAPDTGELDAFAGIWRELDPWPDARAAFDALHEHLTLAILSNVSVAVQTALTAHSHLPFDRLLSAETVKAYKPSPAMYRLAIETLALEPGEIMMVAAHNYDLDAAKEHGFKTAYVASPGECGAPNPAYDINAGNFADLARQLVSRNS